jgi:hypothetical protein
MNTYTATVPSHAELVAEWKIAQLKKQLRDARKELRAVAGKPSDDAEVVKAVMAPYADTFSSSIAEPPAKRRKVEPVETAPIEVVVHTASPVAATFKSSLPEPPAKRRKVSGDDGDDPAVMNLTKAFAAMMVHESDAESDGDGAASAHAKPHLLKSGVTYRVVPEGLATILQELHDGVRKSPLSSVSWAVGTKHDPSSKTPAAIIRLFESQGPMDLKTACDVWKVYGDAEVNAKKFKDFLRELIKQGIVVTVETV